MTLLASRSLRAAVATVVVFLLAPLTVLVLEAPAHADAWMGEKPIAQEDRIQRPWGPQCVPVPLQANDRFGSDPTALIEVVNATSFGKIRVYDEAALDSAGTELASGDTVTAGTQLCYKTNSRFFSGSDLFYYALVDPEPGHARLTGLQGFQISIFESDVNGEGPVTVPSGPTGLTATAGDGQATLDWDDDAGVDTVKVFVDGVVVDTRSVSSTGPLVVGGLTKGLNYAFSVFRPGGSLASRPTQRRRARGRPRSADRPDGCPRCRRHGRPVLGRPGRGRGPVLTGYRVDYALDGVAQTPVDATGTTATLSGITDDQELTATVTAVNEAGDGAASAAATLHPVLTEIEVDAPSTATPGTPVDVDIRAVDATGDTAQWFTGPVQVTSSDITATLPADTSLVDGEATVSVTFADPGTQTVTVTGGGLDGTSDDVTVDKLVPALTLDPSDGAALGEAISTDATLADGLAPTGTVTFRAYGPGDATCSSAAAFTSAVTVAGNDTYSSDDFTPSTRGDYRWTATYTGDDDNTSASAGCTGTVVVSTKPGAPTALTISRGAGDTADLEWSAPSDSGHPDLTGYRVEYSIDGVAQTPVVVSGVSASLSGITDDEAVVAAVTAVNAAGDSPGSASATLRPVITHLEVEAPATATPGVPVQVDVRAVDAGGDTATWFTGDVHLTSSDASASLPADGPLTDGEGTFAVTLAELGDQTVTVTGGGVSGTSAAVTVVMAPATPVVPSLTVAPAAGPHAVGQPLAASAALAGGSAPSGQMSFALFGPAAGNACTGAPVATSTTPSRGTARTPRRRTCRRVRAPTAGRRPTPVTRPTLPSRAAARRPSPSRSRRPRRRSPGPAAASRARKSPCAPPSSRQTCRGRSSSETEDRSSGRPSSTTASRSCSWSSARRASTRSTRSTPATSGRQAAAPSSPPTSSPRDRPGATAAPRPGHVAGPQGERGEDPGPLPAREPRRLPRAGVAAPRRAPPGSTVRRHARSRGDDHDRADGRTQSGTQAEPRVPHPPGDRADRVAPRRPAGRPARLADDEGNHPAARLRALAGRVPGRPD